MRYVTKILAIVGYLFIGVTLLLLLQINNAAMDLTDVFLPGWGRVVYIGLTLCELAAIVFLFLSWFLRPARLILRKNPTPEERKAFSDELRKRLSTNRHVLEAGLSPQEDDFLKKALDVLDERAKTEIRSSAKKTFLGTALSQNGRLDALIVFFSLVRLTWRISGIYNQRPSLREIMSVYSTVSTSTFISFSIEALNIPQTIANSMGELVPAVAPAMAASSVPFVGAAMQKFTSSVIDGAANCLLALRSGIITKNAFRISALGETEAEMNASVQEVGSMLLAISNETVGAIVSALGAKLAGLSNPVGSAISGATSAVTQATKTATQTVLKTTTGIAGGIVDGIGATAHAVGSAGGAVVGAVGNAGGSVVRGGATMAGAVVDGADAVIDAVGSAGGAVVGAVTRGGAAVVGGVADGIGTLAKGSVDAITATGKGTWSLVNKTGEGASALVNESGKFLKNIFSDDEDPRMPNAVYAFRLALYWAKGFLTEAERKQLEQAKNHVSPELARFISVRPTLADLAPWLEPLRDDREAVVGLRDLTPVRAGNPGAEATLKELGDFLGVNLKSDSELA